MYIHNRFFSSLLLSMFRRRFSTVLYASTHSSTIRFNNKFLSVHSFSSLINSKIKNTNSVPCIQQQREKHRFTLNNGVNNKISDEQRDFYEKNGYIIFKQLLPKKDLDRYWKRFEDISTKKVKISPFLILQKEISRNKESINEHNLYKIQELYEDDVLFEYCTHPLVLDLVESFVGPNILAIHSMLINKPPDTGKKSSRHPMHQDLHYFPIRPADRIVGTWTAMEKITKENGCLSVIPGTHTGEHFEHDYPKWEGGVNKLYYGIKDVSNLLDKRVHLEMESGDCVFFHPLLIHGSGINRTKGFRRAISCHYASATDCHYIDVDGTIQMNLANELIEIYFQKTKSRSKNSNETFKELWQYRSRLVRGIDKITTK